MIIGLKGFQEIRVSEVLFFIFFTLLVSFVEESIYRGLILKTLLPKGVKTAVITSSLLFSLTHMCAGSADGEERQYHSADSIPFRT
ncbi:CPBP family intramembrane metalloprotease [Paenibacillus sp. BR2-3]|uniref:CPBP family intramembrane glutamic endopeptidase n=1 Tax=Paenibacillus sp. BR2-3 TaxID=3048494 RepID=UPI003977A139